MVAEGIVSPRGVVEAEGEEGERPPVRVLSALGEPVGLVKEGSGEVGGDVAKGVHPDAILYEGDIVPDEAVVKRIRIDDEQERNQEKNLFEHGPLITSCGHAR